MPNQNPKITAAQVLELTRSFRPACVIMAACELNLFAFFEETKSLSACELSEKLAADKRSLSILLDALAAIEFLEKKDNQYTLCAGVSDILTEQGKQSVFAMVRHQANCLRRWSTLACVVKNQTPPEHSPSILGEQADLASFVQAMDDICKPVAHTIISELNLPSCKHILDLGGATGTWTAAWLNLYPQAVATLFDLPQVISYAKRNLAGLGLDTRVAFCGGDFSTDQLPSGVDLVWISAIVHQQSRLKNQELFKKCLAALAPGGRLLLRDIVMQASRTKPVTGALFAINMLVAAKDGGTFTFKELEEDLSLAGFRNIQLLKEDRGMHSIILAYK